MNNDECPPVAEALVRANCAEIASQRVIATMAMRKISIVNKQVKATSAFYEEPYKDRKVCTDRYTNVCLSCTKPECIRGYCEKTGGRR